MKWPAYAFYQFYYEFRKGKMALFMKPSCASFIRPSLFPGSRYLDWLSAPQDRIMEPPPSLGTAFCERHLQAIWVNARIRPENMVTECGQHIEMIYPGRWNLAAGPDFLDARLKIRATGQEIRGDVEIDMHPSGWHLHGHDTNPDFGNVVVHVTWTPHGKRSQPGLPDSVLRISLSDPVNSRTNFSFEQVDLAAYPYNVPSPEQSPAGKITSWPIELKHGLLQAAGQARLIQKVEALKVRYAGQTLQERLYRQLCIALGYRTNQQPFYDLACKLDWETLQILGRNSMQFAAVLLGQAGLLPDPGDCRDEKGRTWLRQCWDHWWQVRGDLPHPPLMPNDWTLRGIRPVNHPRRRIIALASLCAQSPDFFKQLEKTLYQAPEKSLRLCHKVLGSLRDPFWERRLSLNRASGKTATALIGRDRIRQMFNHGVLPTALPLQPDPKSASAWAKALVPEPHNQVTRESLHYFFGPDAPRTLSQTTLQKMGLLQLFEDWVLTESSMDEQAHLDRLNALENWLRLALQKRAIDSARAQKETISARIESPWAFEA